MNNCPKCLGLLEDKTIEDVPVEVCSVCHGLWFDSMKTLKEIINIDMYCCNHSELNLPDYDHPELKLTTSEQTAYCPICEKELKKEKSMYRCPQQHGFWLDGGEIHQFRRATVKNALIFSAIGFLALLIIVIISMYTSNARSLQKDIQTAKKMAERSHRQNQGWTLYPTQKVIIQDEDDEYPSRRHNF